MTASPIATGIQWGGYGTDISSLPNYTSWSSAITDFDVSGNMTKIIQAGSSGTYPAAYAALNYAPSAAPTTKGKWALPTAGILHSLYTNLGIINNKISNIGGEQLTKNDNEHIWSSSERSDDIMWGFDILGYGGLNLFFKEGNYDDLIVRPVLAF